MKALVNTVITRVLLLVFDHHLAAAASGGRMGGTSFPSSSSSSSSSSSRGSSYYIRGSSYHRDTRPSNNTHIGSPVEFDLLDYCLVISFMVSVYFLLTRYGCKQTSFVKLQVVLLGKAKSLQKDLNQIAQAADTSTPKGLTYILQETTLSLLQQPDYCVSAYSSVEVKRGVEESEKLFNKLSIEERVKFDEVTLVNFNNIRKQSAASHGEVSDGVCNQYIVITIIVAARGVHQLPPIKNSEHLKTALRKLACIPSNNILAAEVLWTPQKEYEF